MDHDFLDLVNVPPFIVRDWIGTGKQYPKTDTPYEVLWAKEDRRKIPDHPNATATFQTKQFALLTSNAFLCLLSTTPMAIPTGLELAQKDAEVFMGMLFRENKFMDAMRLFRKRGQTSHLEGDEE